MKCFRTISNAVVSAVLSLALTAGAAESAARSVPGEINYQGRLFDQKTGDAYSDGTYTLDLRLWGSEFGRTDCLWGARYTVRVKDGLFNVMLGDASAEPLSVELGAVPQYRRPDDLWKALWGMGVDDSVRYLGVTPHQDSEGRELTELSEIVPRHQLINAPYAVRAQFAPSADGADGDFTVTSNLTVEGTTTFTGPLSVTGGGTQTFGHITASSDEILLIGQKTAPHWSDYSKPNVDNVGKTLNFLSYGNMTFDKVYGNDTFSILQGHSIKATGSGTLTIANNGDLKESPGITIGGSGDTVMKGGTLVLKQNSGTINYNQNASEISINGSGTFKVNVGSSSLCGNNTATFKADTLNFASTNDTGKLAFNGEKIVGTGNFKWKQNLDSAEQSPIILCRVSCDIFAGTMGGSVAIPTSSSYDVNQFHWRPVGWLETRNTVGNTLGTVMYDGDSGSPEIWVRKDYGSVSKPYNVIVDVMGINKALCQELPDFNAGTF